MFPMSFMLAISILRKIITSTETLFQIFMTKFLRESFKLQLLPRRLVNRTGIVVARLDISQIVIRTDPYYVEFS